MMCAVTSQATYSKSVYIYYLCTRSESSTNVKILYTVSVTEANKAHLEPIKCKNLTRIKLWQVVWMEIIHSKFHKKCIKELLQWHENEILKPTSGAQHKLSGGNLFI